MIFKNQTLHLDSTFSHNCTSITWLQLICFGDIIFFIACLALSQDTLYPFGPSHRDLETPKMDDGSSPEIPLLIPFIFFSVPYRSLYVSVENNY